MTFIHHYTSPLGVITLASNGDAITGLWFDHQKYFGDNIHEPITEQQLPVFEQACKWLDIYFSGRQPHFTPPLYFNSSPFRMAVWQQLLTIPYGRTTTYGEIAHRLEKEALRSTQRAIKVSAQAVGGAVAHNSISLIIPCHRVIGSNGSLTGYAGGIERKLQLLCLEGITLHSPDTVFFD
jgi:methylated-DNA-[protein]-cysteine S-methyltransferase